MPIVGELCVARITDLRQTDPEDRRQVEYRPSGVGTSVSCATTTARIVVQEGITTAITGNACPAFGQIFVQSTDKRWMVAPTMCGILSSYIAQKL